MTSLVIAGIVAWFLARWMTSLNSTSGFRYVTFVVVTAVSVAVGYLVALLVAKVLEAPDILSEANFGALRSGVAGALVGGVSLAKRYREIRSDR